MKRIVIVSMSTGSGHVRSAKALESYIQKNATGEGESGSHQIVHIDAADHIGHILKFFHIRIYGFLSRHASWLWGWLYRKTNNKKIARLIQQRNPLQQFLAKNLHQTILSYEPDVIVCTYFGSAQLIEPLATQHRIPMYLVGTDYEAHALYVMKHISAYFVPTAKVKHELIHFGVAEAAIHVTGIPIDADFFILKNNEALRNRYHVVPHTKVILIIANAYRERLVKKILKRLESLQNISIFIIGKGFQNIHDKRVKNIGWAKDIEDYMRIADVVITKSGGLTSTECMALNKNVIILRPIAGQEEANAAYLEKHGHAVICKDTKKINTLVRAYLEHHSNSRSSTSQNSEQAAPSNPSEKILEIIGDV